MTAEQDTIAYRMAKAHSTLRQAQILAKEVVVVTGVRHFRH